MKSNRGMGIIQLIISIVVIAIIVALGVYFLRMKYEQAKVQTAKTDMLLVEWKAKDAIEKQTVKGEEKVYIGTKVSEMKEEPLIKEFLNQNIISEEEYEKYYVLTDADLEKLGLEISNYENSFFLINYDNYEIITTKGCEYEEGETLYKLSDILAKEGQKESNNEEPKQEENIQETENE